MVPLASPLDVVSNLSVLLGAIGVLFGLVGPFVINRIQRMREMQAEFLRVAAELNALRAERVGAESALRAQAEYEVAAEWLEALEEERKAELLARRKALRLDEVDVASEDA